MKIDLHNHTNYSDGKDSPLELILRAKKNNVDVMAITDHDSVFGCDEVYNHGVLNGIKVIKGLELSTYYKGEAIHVVCLFKKNKIPQEMMDFSYFMKKTRDERAVKMLNKIHEIYGLKVNPEKLLAESTVITRANMMRHVAKENNMSIDEARFYTSNKSKAYIPSTKMSTKDGIELARRAGCVVIFAHPCLCKSELVEEVLEFGFDGIEVRYPYHMDEEDKFTKLANKYELFISAGSDCHGDADKKHLEVGSCTLNENEFSVIEKLLNEEE